MEARVHRISASSPDDLSGLHQRIEAGLIDPNRIVAVLGKTNGGGPVAVIARRKPMTEAGAQ